MSIGENIKKYRKGKLTQEELGTQIGKTERTIRGYENGDTSPSMEILKKISVALDIPLLDLITDENKNIDSSISVSEVEEIKKDSFYKLSPSLANEAKRLIDGEVNVILPAIQFINDGKYDLQKLLVGDAFQDISSLIKDVVNNRLRFYNNLYEKNNKK